MPFRTFSCIRTLFGCAAILLLSLGGCAYRGAVDESGYKPAPATGGNGAPIGKSSVAFIDSAPLESLTVGYPIGNMPFSMKIGPALHDALLQDLRGTFQTVDTVQAFNKNGSDDFYAFIDHLTWRRVPNANPNVEIYTLSLRFVIVDREQQALISDYRPTTEMFLKHPGGAVAASFATAITLGVLGPVTEQIKNDSWGGEVQTKLKGGIDAIANQINQDLQNDQRLQTLATLGPIDTGPGPDTKTAAGKPGYGKYLDSVVLVRTGDGFGSGFFVGTEGLIVTCRHVVGNAKTVKIKRRDGTSFDGAVIAVDQSRDLALVRIPGAGYPALRIQHGGEAVIGSDVVAIGTPEGMSWTVSKGIVSGLRSARSARLVQTDAAVSPGSSGGPLIDVDSGQVVGVASLAMGGDGAEKLNFAIASEEIDKAFGDKVPAR